VTDDYNRISSDRVRRKSMNDLVSKYNVRVTGIFPGE
jgi:hypothetical protein